MHLAVQRHDAILREAIEDHGGWVFKVIGDAFLVTLTGSGGVGNTRLALRVAEEVYAEYSYGVWLVELASLGEPGMDRTA